MKSRDTLIRLRRFQVEDKRRRAAQIEAMIAEFARMAADLDREIALEEQRAGISDTSQVRPTYNKLLAWGLSMTVIGALGCYLFF